MQSDQFKPKSYLKLIKKKYVFSEGEQFPLTKIEEKPMSLSMLLDFADYSDLENI